MNSQQDRFSDMKLEAYVDGQLSALSMAEVQMAMRADPALADRVRELERLKSLVCLACEQQADQVPEADPQPVRWLGRQQSYRAAMAAAWLMLVGLLGWHGHAWWSAPVSGAVVLALGQAQQPGQYLVQMSSGALQDWHAGLDEVARLLAMDASVRVELLVNDAALGLMVQDSPLASRLVQLHSGSDRLSLVACRQGLDKWRDKGLSLRLLPSVNTQRTALEEVVLKLEQGWRLVRA